MLHFFLSPHFDDAIGSCGGTIARLVEQGRPVRVHTVFGGAPSGLLSDRARELHASWGLGENPVAARRAEDRLAIRRLGATASASPDCEALYRLDDAGRPLHPGSTLEVDAFHPTEAKLVVALARSLSRHVGPRRVRFYAPLGIGGHIDHRIVSRAGVLLGRLGHRVAFYEDFWYRNGASWNLRGTLRRAPSRVSTGQFARKLHALAAYRSQIVPLFGSADRMAAVMAASDRFPGGDAFVEFFWLPPHARSAGARAA